MNEIKLDENVYKYTGDNFDVQKELKYDASSVKSLN